MIILAIVTLVLVSCSHGSPVNPQLQPALDRVNDLDGHVLWGYYKIYIDPAGPTVNVLPARQVEKHFNVKQFVNPPKCNDCLKIKVTGPFLNHILPVDITLKNPEMISGYDVRGILLSDDAGAYLDNPDCYTDLFDNGGPIDINPFKAYAKSEDNRAFGPGESFMEHYDLYLSKFGKVATIDYAVDASWPTRAKEPYDVKYSYSYGQLDKYGYDTITLGFEAYAAGDDVIEVLLDCSSMGFPSDISVTQIAPSTWETSFENTPLADAGDYTCLVKAKSASSNRYLFNYLIVTVVEGTPPLSLQDDIQPILNSHCTLCHQAPGAPLNLVITTGDTYANTVGVDSDQSPVKRITAGDPLNSYLIAKIRGVQMMLPYIGSGDRMPKGGPPWVDPDDENTISEWILQGALDN